MQLILSDVQSNTCRSLEYHVKTQIDLGRAALFTTATTCFNVLYQLAKRPEYVEPIGHEINSIIGGASMHRRDTGKLWKLDSFIRECQKWCSLVTRMDVSTGKEDCELMLVSWLYAQSFEAIAAS